MATAIGLNSDLLTAIDIAKSEILDVYFDSLAEAPDRLRDLICTVKFIHDVLIESIKFLRQCNKTFLGQERFIRKLQECRDFLQRHCIVLPEPSRSPSNRPLKVWKMPGSHDKKVAQEVNVGLTMEMEKLITFIFLVSIKSGDNPPSASATAFRMSGHIPAAGSSVDDIVRRLAGLRKKAERRRNIAQPGNPPELSDLVVQLKQEWNLLCVKAGFIQTRWLPPLPGDRNNPERLLLSSNQSFIDEMIINLSRSSLHYRMNDMVDTIRPLGTAPAPDVRLEDVISGTSQSGSPRPSLRSPGTTFACSNTPASARRSPEQHTIPRILPDQNQVTLGEPALPVCVAKWIINNTGLKLQRWCIETSYSGQYIIWRGIDPTHTLKHILPPDTFPYTKHISLTQTSKVLRNTVTFDDAHKFVWSRNGELKAGERIMDYYIVDDDDFKKFQGDLRDKDLLDTFNIDTIKTKQSTRYGDAGNQDLKMWCSRDEDEVYTISFFANHAENKHREYAVRWFSPKIKTDDTERTVVLNFAKPIEPGSPTGSPRHSIISRTFSFGRRGAPATGLLAPNTTTALSNSSNVSPRASVSTFSSNLSHISSGGAQSPSPPQDLVNNVKYLHIYFTKNEDNSVSEDEDDYHRFKKLWATACRAATEPRSPRGLSIYNLETAQAATAGLVPASPPEPEPLSPLKHLTISELQGDVPGVLP